MLRLSGLGFLLGHIVYFALPSLPGVGVWLLWGIIFMSLMMLYGYYRIFIRSHVILHAFFLGVFSTLLGFSLAGFQTNISISQLLPKDWESKPIQVVGKLTSLEQENLNYSQFTLKVNYWIFNNEKILNNNELPNKLKLNWYHYKNSIVPNLGINQEWLLTVRLKRPHGFQNPGGYDYERWLFTQKIRATGYVDTKGDNRLIASPKPSLSFTQIREKLARQSKTHLSDSSVASMILALSLGIRGDMTPEQWDTLRLTGTSHLMAISGLHIGLVAGLVFMLINRLWPWFPYLVLKLPAPKAAALFALFAAFIYSGLAGFSVPTQRALIMVLAFTLNALLSRQINPWNSLTLALIAVLLLDPFAVLSPGFWLSFSAVAVILFGTFGRVYVGEKSHAGYRLRQMIRVQWIVTLGLLPLTLLFFQEASLISPLANFIAIPWVGFVVIPLSLIGTLLSNSVFGGLLVLADWSLSILWIVLEWMARFRFSAFQLHHTPLWTLLLASMGTCLLLAPKGWPGRYLGLFTWLPLLIWRPVLPELGTAHFALLDVGQGLVSVIQTQNHVLVFDTGPRYSDNFNAGSAVVVPYLKTRHISSIDKLMISHDDLDHTGGLNDIRKSVDVHEIFAGESASLPEDHPQTSLCRAGQEWHWDGVDFQVLYPFTQMMKGNDNSCVLRIRIGEQVILLTGDIERASEEILLSNLGESTELLHADILVVPHHGSTTSSTQEFVDAVNPKYALFPTGYKNRFKLPREEIVTRYESIGAILYNTPDTGAIIFNLDGHLALSPWLYKQESARLWH